jgi:glycosyltransferase involved in cell wall biosynthesis
MVGHDTPNPKMLNILLGFEARAYRWSDHVIVVNDSFKEVAMTRGGVPESKISIVRNGPNDAVLNYQPTPSATRADDDIRRVGYLGNVNAQDGLDLLVEIAAEAKTQAIPFVYEIIGDGGGLPAIRALVEERDVAKYFNFHGRKRWGGEIEENLARCDFCVQPDPYSELNEKCSMTKSLEYLARGKTFVSYPLKETLHSCADFAYFADNFSKEAFVRKFFEVLATHTDEDGAFDTRQRYIRENFSWMISERAYADTYRKLLNLG